MHPASAKIMRTSESVGCSTPLFMESIVLLFFALGRLSLAEAARFEASLVSTTGCLPPLFAFLAIGMTDKETER